MRLYHYSCLSCRVTMINGHATHESGCNDVFQIKRYAREYGLFQVYSLDVLGNKRDGYEVNDRSRYGRPILVPLDDDRAIIRELKRNYMINKRTHFKTWVLDGDDRSIYVDHVRLGPYWELERL